MKSSPVCLSFAEQHPKLGIELLMSDRTEDLIAALRLGPLADSGQEKMAGERANSDFFAVKILPHQTKTGQYWKLTGAYRPDGGVWPAAGKTSPVYSGRMLSESQSV